MRHDNARYSADSGVAAVAYACGGIQITRFGATSGGHLGDQTAR